MDARDVAVRSVKTFAEAAAAFLIAEIGGAELFAMDRGMWFAIGISAVAAGVAAVWNGVLAPMLAPLLKRAKREPQAP